MKIVLPKTLAEPGTIPWEKITSNAQREIDMLLSSLMDDLVNQDMDELMVRIEERFRIKNL